MLLLLGLGFMQYICLLLFIENFDKGIEISSRFQLELNIQRGVRPCFKETPEHWGALSLTSEVFLENNNATSEGEWKVLALGQLPSKSHLDPSEGFLNVKHWVQLRQY